MQNSIHRYDWSLYSNKKAIEVIAELFSLDEHLPVHQIIDDLCSLKQATLELIQIRTSSCVYQIRESGKIYQVSGGQCLEFDSFDDFTAAKATDRVIDQVVAEYQTKPPAFILKPQTEGLYQVIRQKEPRFTAYIELNTVNTTGDDHIQLVNEQWENDISEEQKATIRRKLIVYLNKQFQLNR